MSYYYPFPPPSSITIPFKQQHPLHSKKHKSFVDGIWVAVDDDDDNDDNNYDMKEEKEEKIVMEDYSDEMMFQKKTSVIFPPPFVASSRPAGGASSGGSGNGVKMKKHEMVDLTLSDDDDDDEQESKQQHQQPHNDICSSNKKQNGKHHKSTKNVNDGSCSNKNGKKKNQQKLKRQHHHQKRHREISDDCEKRFDSMKQQQKEEDIASASSLLSLPFSTAAASTNSSTKKKKKKKRKRNQSNVTTSAHAKDGSSISSKSNKKQKIEPETNKNCGKTKKKITQDEELFQTRRVVVTLSSSSSSSSVAAATSPSSTTSSLKGTSKTTLQHSTAKAPTRKPSRDYKSCTNILLHSASVTEKIKVNNPTIDIIDIDDDDDEDIPIPVVVRQHILPPPPPPQHPPCSSSYEESNPSRLQKDPKQHHHHHSHNEQQHKKSKSKKKNKQQQLQQQQQQQQQQHDHSSHSLVSKQVRKNKDTTTNKNRLNNDDEWKKRKIKRSNTHDPGLVPAEKNHEQNDKTASNNDDNNTTKEKQQELHHHSAASDSTTAATIQRSSDATNDDGETFQSTSCIIEKGKRSNLQQIKNSSTTTTQEEEINEKRIDFRMNGTNATSSTTATTKMTSKSSNTDIRSLATRRKRGFDEDDNERNLLPIQHHFTPDEKCCVVDAISSSATATASTMGEGLPVVSQRKKKKKVTTATHQHSDDSCVSAVARDCLDSHNNKSADSDCLVVKDTKMKQHQQQHQHSQNNVKTNQLQQEEEHQQQREQYERKARIIQYKNDNGDGIAWNMPKTKEHDDENPDNTSFTLLNHSPFSPSSSSSASSSAAAATLGNIYNFDTCLSKTKGASSGGCSIECAAPADSSTFSSVVGTLTTSANHTTTKEERENKNDAKQKYVTSVNQEEKETNEKSKCNKKCSLESSKPLDGDDRVVVPVEGKGCNTRSDKRFVAKNNCTVTTSTSMPSSSSLSDTTLIRTNHLTKSTSSVFPSPLLEVEKDVLVRKELETYQSGVPMVSSRPLTTATATTTTTTATATATTTTISATSEDLNDSFSKHDPKNPCHGGNCNDVNTQSEVREGWNNNVTMTSFVEDTSIDGVVVGGVGVDGDHCFNSKGDVLHGNSKDYDTISKTAFSKNNNEKHKACSFEIRQQKLSRWDSQNMIPVAETYHQPPNSVFKERLSSDNKADSSNQETDIRQQVLSQRIGASNKINRGKPEGMSPLADDTVSNILPNSRNNNKPVVHGEDKGEEEVGSEIIHRDFSVAREKNTITQVNGKEADISQISRHKIVEGYEFICSSRDSDRTRNLANEEDTMFDVAGNISVDSITYNRGKMMTAENGEDNNSHNFNARTPNKEDDVIFADGIEACKCSCSNELSRSRKENTVDGRRPNEKVAVQAEFSEHFDSMEKKDNNGKAKATSLTTNNGNGKDGCSNNIASSQVLYPFALCCKSLPNCVSRKDLRQLFTSKPGFLHYEKIRMVLSNDDKEHDYYVVAYFDTRKNAYKSLQKIEASKPQVLNWFPNASWKWSRTETVLVEHRQGRYSHENIRKRFLGKDGYLSCKRLPRGITDGFLSCLFYFDTPRNAENAMDNIVEDDIVIRHYTQYSRHLPTIPDSDDSNTNEKCSQHPTQSAVEMKVKLSNLVGVDNSCTNSNSFLEVPSSASSHPSALLCEGKPTNTSKSNPSVIKSDLTFHNSHSETDACAKNKTSHCTPIAGLDNSPSQNTNSDVWDGHNVILVQMMSANFVCRQDLSDLFKNEPGFVCTRLFHIKGQVQFGYVEFCNQKNANNARRTLPEKGLKEFNVETLTFQCYSGHEDTYLHQFSCQDGFLLSRLKKVSGKKKQRTTTRIGMVFFNTKKNADTAKKRLSCNKGIIIKQKTETNYLLRRKHFSAQDGTDPGTITTHNLNKIIPQTMKNTTKTLINGTNNDGNNSDEGLEVSRSDKSTADSNTSSVAAGQSLDLDGVSKLDSRPIEKGKDSDRSIASGTPIKATGNKNNSSDEAPEVSGTDENTANNDSLNVSAGEPPDLDGISKLNSKPIEKDQGDNRSIAPETFQERLQNQNEYIGKDKHATLVVSIVPSGMTHKDLSQVFEKESGFLCATVLEQNNGIVKFDSWENAERARRKMDGFTYWAEGLNVSHLAKLFFGYDSGRYPGNQILKVFNSWKGFIFAKCLHLGDKKQIDVKFGFAGFNSEKNAEKAAKRMFREGLTLVSSSELLNDELRAQASSPHLDYGLDGNNDMTNASMEANLPMPGLSKYSRNQVSESNSNENKSHMDQSGYFNRTGPYLKQFLQKDANLENDFMSEIGVNDNEPRPVVVDLTEQEDSICLKDRVPTKSSDRTTVLKNTFAQDLKSVSSYGNISDESGVVDDVASSGDETGTDETVITIVDESTEENDEVEDDDVETATPACLRLQKRRLAAQKRQKQALCDRRAGPEFTSGMPLLSPTFGPKKTLPTPKLKFKPKAPSKLKKTCRSQSNSSAGDSGRSRSNSDTSSNAGQCCASIPNEPLGSVKVTFSTTNVSNFKAEQRPMTETKPRQSSKENSCSINTNWCTNDLNQTPTGKFEPRANQTSKEDLIGENINSYTDSTTWHPAGKSLPKANTQKVGCQSHSAKPRVFSTYIPSQEELIEEQERLLRASAAKVRQRKDFERRMQFAKTRILSFSRPVEDLSKLPSAHWKWTNLYSRLGLPQSSGEALVRKQYRRLALLYHPDKSKLKDAPDRFQAIKEAYEHLTNKFASR